MGKKSPRMQWLSLIEVSGPFLVGSILDDAFPQGLERVASDTRRRLRDSYDEWREAVDEGDNGLEELHGAWIEMVLKELPEYDDEILQRRSELNGGLLYTVLEHAVEIAPDVVVSSRGEDYRLLVSIYPPGTDLKKPLPKEFWPASPAERMTLLCRKTDVRLGLITNGEQWMLVNAPIGSTSGCASWFARIWWQEPDTLRAFQSLLGVRRCFGPTEERIERLIERSLEFQEEDHGDRQISVFESQNSRN